MVSTLEGQTIQGFNWADVNVEIVEDGDSAGTGPVLRVEDSTGTIAEISRVDGIVGAVGGSSIDKSVSYTLAAIRSVFGTSGGAGIDLTLPAATAVPKGSGYFMKKVDAGAGALRFVGTIDGAANLSLTVRYQSARVISNGTAWYVENIYTPADCVGTVAAPRSLSTTATTACAGNDSRLTVPSDATATPTASKIPISTASVYLADGWTRVPPTAVDFGVTAPYTAVAADKTIEVTTGAVSSDVDLLTAVGKAGYVVCVKKVDAGVGTVSVDPSGAEVIEAAGAGVAYVLTNQGESVTLQSNGTQWYILHTNIAPAAHAATHRNAAADPIRRVVRSPVAGACAIATTDEYVRVDSGGAGAVAATLYAADAAAVGRVVTVTKIDVAADDVNVTPAGVETINGVAAAYALAAQWNSVTLLCVAVGQWEIIASR